MKSFRSALIFTTVFSTMHGGTYTWIGVDSNNNLEDFSNWNPPSVPGSGDDAFFDIAIPNIALNPTDNTDLFSVSTFNFVHKAFPFTFFFNNQALNFVGAGILGTATDAEINITNVDNSINLGNLLVFFAPTSTSGSANIFISNEATLSGLISGATIGDFDTLMYAQGDFTLGSLGIISARNIGTDNASGTGNNTVAKTNSHQIRLDGATFAENNSLFSAMNTGIHTGVNTVQNDTVATIGGSQFLATGTFQADNEFFLDVRNSGVDQGNGVGGDFIGDVSGQQAHFQNGFILGENGAIHIENSGNSSSLKGSGSTVGSLIGDSHQLFVQGNFEAGNNLNIFVQNVGNDSTTGAGGDTIGCINTVSNSGSQIHLDSGGTIGNNASIFMLNSSFRSRSTASASSNVGVLGNQQFYSAGAFQAGDNLSFQTLNGAASFSTGQTNQNIGVIGSSQVEFATTCTLGKNAFFNLVNTGFNTDSTSTSNSIAVVQGCQFKASGNFTAEDNLLLLAYNQSLNFGDASNDVGLINDSQISFQQECNLNNSSVISASNNGLVSNCQIEFLDGFNVLSGKAFIQAINNGTIGCFGIEILGNNGGGNAEIELVNSSLSIDTTLPTFTIGGLKGDATSFAESNPTLIINTDSSTHVNFEGTIQDFPTSITNLIKSGSGTQILSGTNSYTGLTTVSEGNLVLNGSVAKDLFVDLFGTLKGTGTIGGNLINSGTVSPGQSIGTLTVLGNYTNNPTGIYAVEVNGSGDSDLISVVGQAGLNGGKVVVTTEDGSFQLQQPYTIVTTEAGVIGTYDSVTSTAFINPLLSYDPFNVFLIIESDLQRAARSCNQIGVATNLDAIPNLDPIQTSLINAIANMSLSDAQDALESLSGFQYAHDVWMTEISIRRFLRNIYNPIRTTTCMESSKAWLELSDISTRLSGKNAHKAHADGYQVTGGVQKMLFSNLTLGLAGSYEQDRLSFQKGHANRNTSYLAAYGLYNACPYYALFDLVYGHTSSKFKRSIRINDVREEFHSKPKIDLFSFYGEAGFDIYYNCFLIQPFAGIQIGKRWHEKIRENRFSDFSLTISERSWDATSSRLGFHAATDNFYGFDLSIDLAWNQLLSCTKNRTKGRFNQFGDAFQICGNDLDQTSIDYAINLSTCLSPCLKGYLEVAGESWDHAHTYELLGGIEYSW